MDSNTGLVTARKAGTVVVTATTWDGGLTASCTVTVNYCGGSDYRNVTKHNMVLQNDGYYVCSTCGYRVKSPELEDADILSFEDYLTVVSAEQLYIHYEHLIQQNSIYNLYRERQERIDRLISSIRRKSEYVNKYSYADGTGHCYGAEVIDEYSVHVSLTEITLANITRYNGIDETIHALVIGRYASESITFLANIVSLLTTEMDMLEFSAAAADVYGYKRISEGLTIASGLLKCSRSNVELGDRLVRITIAPYRGDYIYSQSGELKAVKIELI